MELEYGHLRGSIILLATVNIKFINDTLSYSLVYILIPTTCEYVLLHGKEIKVEDGITVAVGFSG